MGKPKPELTVTTGRREFRVDLGGFCAYHSAYTCSDDEGPFASVITLRRMQSEEDFDVAIAFIELLRQELHGPTTISNGSPFTTKMLLKQAQDRLREALLG